MTRELIDKRTAEWDPKMVEDPVQDRLLEIIEAKKKKQKPAKAARASSSWCRPRSSTSTMRRITSGATG